MCVFYWIVEKSGCDKTCGVSHVNHKESSHLVSYFAHALVIPLTAVCRTTTDDELRLVLDGKALHLVIIHATSFLVEVVAYGIVEDT